MINKNILNMGGSKLRNINDLANKYKDVIKLTLGEPHFEVDKLIKKGVYEELEKNNSKYSTKGGSKESKQIISKYVEENFKLNYKEDEVVITNGASMGLTSIMRTIISEGDEVIIITPAYPIYEELIKIFGGVVVKLDSSYNNFRLDVDLLKKKITKKTKAIIINYPNNPTGVSLSLKEQKKLVSLIKENDVFLISDEVYNKISYNDDFLSIGKYKEIREKTIIVNSFSKSYSIPGYRIGYVLADSKIIGHIRNVNHYFTSSISNLSSSTIKYINNISIEDKIKHYKENLELISSTLNNKLDFIKPEGTFYLFVNISKTNKKSLEFTEKLLEEKKVLVIPGIVFGESFDSYIRLSYACEKEKLQKGLERILDFVSTNK